MRKKILTVLLAGMMAMSTLAACGDAEETTDVKTTAESNADSNADSTADEEESTDMCSDETFEALQDNYATMVDCYNQVKDLYESDEIAADTDIENLMNEAADIINEMGEISQDSITESDADDLNEAMLNILDGLSTAVDAMETTGADDTAAADTTSASGEMCSDETFATLQDNYAKLTDCYNTVYDAYMSDEIEQDDDIESTLTEAADLIEEMGEISQDSVTEEDAVILNDSMSAVLQVLFAVVNAM